ncbi:zinc finger CCHC domain-containing protein 8-like [Oppia nitens]|uniref:zinc finger CCHC domain-containing protein 8-like n=1 Tax=Oppia nitens TaxID=1686743 RepID=UPI0023DCD57E|nr:zinc finger CCHC domain-containing protein 8-like [Oppia nitens]
MAKRYFDNSAKQKPGIISDELRRALNIHDDKLPIWIYRMRVLGYPPGYLQQAQVNTLSIFDDAINAAEDGEVRDTPAVAAAANPSGVQYNKESFIEYPGFNCPVPYGVKDDWHYLRMPPMLEQQQLKEALKTMRVMEPVPYKRAKMDLPSTTTTTTPPSSSSTASRRSSTNRKSDSSFYGNNESLNNSSLNSSKYDNSVVDLESDDDVVVLEDTPPKSSSNGNVSKTSQLSETESQSTTTTTTTALTSTPVVLHNESTDSERKLKLISMGSPMPVSERTKKPALEKWSEGMGELLYFENPESVQYTGIYKTKMKAVIDKIREKTSSGHT